MHKLHFYTQAAFFYGRMFLQAEVTPLVFCHHLHCSQPRTVHIFGKVIILYLTKGFYFSCQAHYVPMWGFYLNSHVSIHYDAPFIYCYICLHNQVTNI